MVVRSIITQKMVLNKIKKATQEGLLALIEQMVTLRLKDHFGSVTHTSSAHSSQRSRAQKSLKTYRSLSVQSVKGKTQYQPILVETSSEKEDDASTITTHSRPIPKPAEDHGHMAGLNDGDVILLGGPKEVSGGILKPLIGQKPIDVDDPPPKEPHYLKLDNAQSPFSGTLIDLTKLPKVLASSILVQLNEPRISPMSESTDFGPHDTSQGENLVLISIKRESLPRHLSLPRNKSISLILLI